RARRRLAKPFGFAARVHVEIGVAEDVDFVPWEYHPFGQLDGALAAPPLLDRVARSEHRLCACVELTFGHSSPPHALDRHLTQALFDQHPGPSGGVLNRE